MSACERYEADLSALLDGELDSAKEEELRAHMAGCPECRELYETFSLLHEEALEPPTGLAAGIMAAVHAQAAGNVTQMPKPKNSWKSWLAAAACAAVVLGAVTIPRLFDQKPGNTVDAAVRTIPQTQESAPPETEPEDSPDLDEAASPSPEVTPDSSDKAGSGNAGSGNSGGYTVVPAPSPMPVIPTPTPVVTTAPTPTPTAAPPAQDDPTQPEETAPPPEETQIPKDITTPEDVALLISRLGESVPAEAPGTGVIPILLVMDHDHVILAVYIEGNDVIYTVDGEQYYRCPDAADKLIESLSQE